MELQLASFSIYLLFYYIFYAPAGGRPQYLLLKQDRIQKYATVGRSLSVDEVPEWIMPPDLPTEGKLAFIQHMYILNRKL